MADVVLTVAICLTQLILGIMGVYVALKPPSTDKHKRWISAFIVVGLLGIIFAAWLAQRAGKAQTDAITKIAELERKLAHAHIRTEITSIAVEDASKFRGFAKMEDILNITRKARFNITFRNVSSSNVTRSGGLGTVIIANAVPDFNTTFVQLNAKFQPGWTGTELVPQQQKFFTVESRLLSRQDIKQITAGKSLGIYIMAVVKFSDSTGDYQQELCSWLQPPGTDSVWHDCGVHDSETQVK